MSETIDVSKPQYQYGVLWKLKPVWEGDTSDWTEYSGNWHSDIPPALKELERARVHPRCADARVFSKKIAYTELTNNAVEWLKKELE